jgi:putative transposase
MSRRAMAQVWRKWDDLSTGVSMRSEAASVAAMARLPRYLLPKRGIYHITTRGVARVPISRDDGDRRLFLLLLARITRRTDWDCHAFCLMPNHHHLILETHRDLVSVGLRQLNGRYAQAFNERHGRSGHLFGDRFAAFVIGDDEHLRAATDYVLQNPVRAGLCKRAEDWPWSGARRALSSGRARR